MKLITTLCGMLLFCAISVQSENLEVSTGGVNKFEEAPENDEEVESNWFQLQHETIEQQADQPTSGEQFIAIRIGSAGSKDQINPNLEGLVRIATQFLPNSYTFINVVSASREVVAGIKYELLVNALDENRSEILCEIRILEQPWIITNNNEKLRTLIYSNCSTDIVNSNEPKIDDTQHRINPIFNNEEQIMTDERLKVMESLIITTDNKTPKPIVPQQPENISSNHGEDEDALTVVTLSKGTSSFLDDFFSFGKTESKPIQGSLIENDVMAKLEVPTRIEAIGNRRETDDTLYHVGLNTNEITSIVSNVETSTQTVTTQVNNIQAQLNGDVAEASCAHVHPTENTSVANVGPETQNLANKNNMNENVERQKRASMDDNRRMSMERRLFSKLLTATLARLDRYDEDDNKRVFLKVIKSQVYNNVYKFEVRIADTNCRESLSSAENCLSHIIDDSIKLCRLEIEHLANDDIKIKKTECIPDSRVKRQLGAPRPVSESEQEEVIGFINTALQNGDKPGFSLTRVNKATKQIVSGSLYKVEAEFSVDGSTKLCNIKIWDRPWLGISAREVTFVDCNDSARRKRQVSDGAGNRGVSEIPLVGGVNTIPNSNVASLLSEVLSEGDYQNYRLIRIIQAKHQLVAGSLYHIKAEFVVDQLTKICNMQIWDRPWLGKAAREVEFTCDGDVARVKRSNSPTSRTLKGGITSISDSENSKVEELLNEVLVGSDYQSYRLIRLIEASKQVVAGILYRIKGEFEVEGVRKICNVKIWAKVAGEGKEITEFNCEVTNNRSKRHIPGGVTHTSEPDKVKVESLLNEVLSDSDYQSYRSSREKRQIPGGIISTSETDKTKIEALLNEILAKDDYRSYRSSREKRQIPGGIISTSETDKTKIEALLNEILAKGDYRSYRLIRIIESTVQIVSGTIYNIKAEFTIDSLSKICNIKIWDRPWLSKSTREVEFKCDDLSRRKRQIRGGFKSIIVREKEIDNDFLTYVENIIKDILQSDDYRSYKLIRVLDSTSEVNAGFMYRIKAEFSINDLANICNIKIWEKESNQGREVQEFICHNQNKPHISGKSLLEQNHSEYALDEAFIARDINLDMPDIEKIQLEDLLKSKLINTAYKDYRLVRIIEFTKENVAGDLYRIKAEFTIDGIGHICDAKLWNKSSGREKGVQEMKCTQKSILSGFNPIAEEDQPKVEKLLREVLAYDDYKSYTLIKIIQIWQQIVVGINYKIRIEVKVKGELKICDIKILDMFTKHKKHAVQSVCQNIGEIIAGGSSPISSDKTVYIESIVNGALLQGNYQTYKLVKIIEANKQILEGVIYRIKAQFVVNNTVDRICNLKIWDKVSNQRREVQEFICEVPTIPTVSHSSRPILGGIIHASEDDKSVIENILKGILSTGDYQSYTLVRIIESSKQIVAGILYRIKAEFAVDGTQKICNVKILDKISNQGREVQEFICEETTIPSINHSSVLPESHANVVTTATQQHSIPGGIIPASKDDKSVIENILKGILSTGDYYQSYRLVRIIESSKQIVAGILYRIKAEFAVDGTQKICNVKILDKVSNLGREVQEFICEETTIPSINHSSVLPESHANVVTATTQKHSIPGGIIPTSEDDKSVIENILKWILSTGDYQSYRLVRIIESSKQIVAGILYRIKAEFAVDGTQKICNVKILDKVSNQGREVQEFICEETTIPSINHSSVLPGAHANVVTTITQQYSIPGGIIPASEDDKSVIENILKGILSTGDYQSYRLVRIIKSSKQIVAGILYRIKAEFAVDGSQKICNVKILDKVSNQGREVQEFICEETTIPSINDSSVIPGSHASVATVTTQQHFIPGGIIPTSEDDKSVIENILKGILSTGDYQSYRLVRIIESSKQIVAGILYRIKAEFAVDGTQKICNVKILDKVSNQGREVQEFICEETTIPSINHSSVLPESHVNVVTTATQQHSIPGSIIPASEDDKSVIENILKGILSTGDYHSYRLVRIIESSKQIVAGILYRIKAEFAVDGTQKICNVKILDKISNQGREVQEFICEETTIPSINHSSVLPESHANVVTTATQQHSIPGGIIPASEDDKSVIENILKGILSTGDYQSYRLVRIIESSKQIVAGILYRIKAEFAVDGTQKICNVKILDKVSNQGREVQEFICEETTIPSINHSSVLPESHANVVITATQQHSIPGGIIPASEDDKSVIENILKGILSTGDYQSYRLVRIIESSKQIVAGILYRIKAEFAVDGTQKICNVKILDKVSNQAREVQEFICEETTIPSINQSSVIPGSHASVVTTATQQHSIPGGIIPASEDDKSVIENILKGILFTGDYQSYRLVRIIESSKQIVAGILYRIKAEFAVDGTQKICNVKILDKVSNQGREVQEFICEETTIPSINHSSVLPESHANVVTATTQQHSIPEGIIPASENDKSVIVNILKGILSTGDYQSYRLVRIIESSKQIVAGILYRIKAEFAVNGTQKICNVKILDKVSNQGREVQEFICEETTIPSINQSSVIPGSHASVVTTATQQHSIPGGIIPTSEDDKSVIENILKGILFTGDYQSYRLVRIIESSKQIVAGILYRIKAEFAVDGTQKICNVKILDKVSNQGREVQEFICEETTIPSINHSSVLPESHANVVTTATQQHSIPGGILPASEDDKSVIENILKGILSTGVYQSYRLVRIIESSKQIVAGILYRIKAEFAVNGTQKICNVKILDKISNQGREVQEFICEETTIPSINHSSVLPESHANVVTTATQQHSIPGGIIPASEDDKSVIENILKGILSTGDYQSYRLVRIIESSKQIVAGILYRIKAEFAVDGTQKICNVKILDKVSNQGREIQEFICEETTIPSINHSSVLPESHVNVVTATTQQHSRPLLGGIIPTSEDDKSVIKNILKGILSTGDYQSYRLVRIIESSKQIVAGILYRIKAEFAVDGTQKICNVKILDKVSNQGREIQEFICEETTIPSINHSSVLPESHVNVITATTQQHSRPLLGGIIPTSEDDKSVIENILKGILSTGDYQSYRLVRIIESSKQIVAGILYRIKAEFAVDGTQKICNVKILDKVSNQGREVQEFICEETTIPSINHSSVLPGAHTNAVTATTQQHSIPGGIIPASEDDKSVIENILKGILSTGDYQSYRLVRIIESSKQIVAGILYRIKAEFAVDGTQKICNVKILDKVSNQGREVQEFICEETTIPSINHSSVLPESHANVVTTATQQHSIPGGIIPASEDDKSVIENILKGILSTGDYQSYRLVRIIESSKQIVAGILYRIKAEFAVDGTQKICNVKILDKVSNQGREIQEFICEETTIPSINHSSVLPESHVNVVTATTQQHSRPLLGGIIPTSEDDKSVIKNILKGILSTGDYQSYRLVRIIESSKQIVAGILYRIKAEFAVDGTQKICNVKILDKVSNQGREIQEFICEETTIPSINHSSVLPESHVNVVTATTQQHSKPLLGGIIPTSEDDKSVIENILKGILSTGDYQSYRLVRIIESSKQIVAGILYRIKAEFAVDGTQKICNVKILDKVSNQGREVQEFICEETTIPSINHSSVLPGAHTNAVTATTQQHFIPGGIIPTSEDDKSVIENILKGILSTGDYQSYRLVRIIESSKQIVAGILYRIKAEFAVDGTQKICNVKILDKVSNQGREVQEFICEETTIPSINHSSVLPESHANVVTTATQQHSIPGGIIPASEDDKSVIENILKGILSTGDYQSYRLVRIIESSKQIVAGILYRIKAEFAVNGTQKICNVKILDKISNQGREVQEFICEETTIPSINHSSVLPGAHTNAVTATTQQHFIPGGIIPASEDDKSVIENILKGILSTGDYQSYRLVRIIESSKQIVAGILYRIKAEFAVDGTQKICNVKILDKVSNQGREVQEFICEETTIPSINHSSVLPGAHTNAVTATTQQHFIPGGIIPASEDDKSVIENILKGILSTGDYHSYRLVRIIESSKQIVAGILYRIKAEFAVDGTQKICNVKILDKVSNQGREVQEFICEETTIPSINHSAVLPESHANVVTTATQQHSIPGGIIPASEDDKSVIENILKWILSTGDYQSYRLVRIIESSKQIVAGILYRIKAEFAVDGTQKICNVKILDKVSNQGREIQEFICEETTIPSINHSSVLPESHVNVVTATTQQHSRPLLGGIIPTSEDDKSVIENILKGILSTGDYQSYRLVRIIESSKQIVAGILYRIKAEFAVDGTQKICNVKILDKVSNQGREVQEFICEETTIPSINHSSVLPGAHTNAVTATTQQHFIPGGIIPASEDDKSVIENILKGILSTGDYQSYRLVRIIESSKQIVAGILYRIKAEFAVDGTQKICNVKILDKVSNQGREVQEFICEETTIPSINHSSVLPESHANVVTTATQQHSIPGGIIPASEDDKSVIENILKGILSTGDYQSYRLVRIIESSKQIVAGILYRIKAEFAVDGTQKICNVKILDKVSNQGREIQEFICEETTIPSINHSSVLPESHVNVVTATTQQHSRPLLGGIIPTSEDDKSVIKNILKGILSTGDYQSYRLVRIIESSKQIVAGILYRIKAEFAVDGTQKICNVKILDKVSNQGREIQEFICEETTIPSINHSSVLPESHVNVVTATTQQHSRPLLGGIIPTSEDDKSVIENILKGILSTGDYQSYRLVRIIESSKQIVAGILYRIKAEFAVDGTQKICNVKILDKVSNQGREVQEFICEETTIPSINHSSVLPGAHTNAVTATTQQHFIPGGIIPASEDDKSVIENILKGILSTGDYHSYRLVRIIESSKQIVAGILYRIKAEFAVDGTQKICNVKILDKISNQGREVQEFICEETTIPSINHSSVLPESHANVVTTATQQHSIPGGIIPASEDDKSVIKNILKGILSTGDYQSYRLVRIIESSKQIVAGILYRIKAEFAVDGTQKICNVKILDKVSNQGREVQEFICEETTIPSINHSSVLPGAHTNAVTATTQQHFIPGGIIPASEDDKSVIENILKGILSTGDYHSYRLVRIIESSKQIVAGILYRIKAEFAVDGTQKICNVKILDKVSNQGREVQEFICEETTIPSINHSSVLPESHANVVTTATQQHSIPGGIIPASEDDKSVIENILKGILSTGDYQSYRLVRIIESSKQIVAGILYRIKAEFAVDGTQKICNVKILDKISNQGREVQEFICEETTIPSINHSAVLPESHANVVTATSQQHFIPGGIIPTSEDDKSVIENILKGILSTGDYHSYRLVRIIESSKQIVAGILYRIKAEFAVDGTQKICNVKILDKVSNQGREVQEFICEETTIPSINHSSVLPESHANVVTTATQQHSIPGGIIPASEDDKSVIENILKGILSTGDYQSYRLVRIIESSKQIVAGILYRIKAEFAVDGTQKICNVKILDKVSNEGREVQEFICEETTIPSINHSSVLPGAHTNAVTATTQQHFIPGGIIPASEDDKSVIENILKGILSTGDYHSYRLVRLIESSKQIVAGILYRIKAEFAVDGAQKICNVKILDKVSNQGREVQEFICEETSIPSINHSSVLPESHANVVTTATQQHSIPGGIIPASEDDKSVIENILKGILSTGDYQSYRLVRIIESSKQIVAGILYRIKAEFAVDGTQKICNVKILDKVSNQGREVQEFICDVPNFLSFAGFGLSAISPAPQDILAPFLGVSTTEDDKPVVERLFNGVLSTSNYESYKLVRIIESSKQINPGIIYQIKAEFLINDVSHICYVKFWNISVTQIKMQHEFKCRQTVPILNGFNSINFHDKFIVDQKILGGISSITVADKNKIESLLNEVLSNGDYQSYRLVRIIESTKQIVSGIVYKIKAEFNVDGLLNICNVKIWDRPWLGKSGRQVEFNCEKITRHKRQSPGEMSTIADGSKIERILNEVLVGDYSSYRLLKIIKTSVTETLFRIKAEFDLDGAEKFCDIKILKTPINEENKVVQFSCVRKRAIRRRSSSSSSSSSSDSSESSERSNKNKIRNVLNDVLTYDDYQSYRLVRIVQGSRQKLTSGTLYYIEAIFLIDGDQRQCNVNINERNKTNRKVYFNCEQPTVVLPTTAIRGGFTIVPISERDYIQNLVTEVLSEGEYQTYRVIRIIEASSQVVSGINYRIKAEFAVEDVQKTCVIKIWVKLSNEEKEVTEFTCEEPQEQQHTAFLWRKVREVQDKTLGSITKVSESDKSYVESLLRDELLTGDYHSYRLVRIIRATEQVVAGSLFNIEAEFIIDGNTRVCFIKIWDQPWLGKSGRSVEFKGCNGDNLNRNKRNAPALGAPRPLQENEFPKIEEMLNSALAEGDRQNYRLTRILHATKQLASGWTFKIRGAFEVEGVIKRCNIKIWNRPWLPNANTIESFKCDELDEHTIRLNHDAKIKGILDIYLFGNYTDNKIFEIYEKLFNKNYPTILARNLRLRIFKTNLRKIRNLNQHELGTATYGITEFADLTSTEYRMRTGLVRRTTPSNHISNPVAEIPNIVLPREFDWRTRGVISEVKNQGSCGSCWAFSVIGNIEGLHAIKTGVLEEYSEQELVDCDTIDSGCNGGLPDDAYKAIEQLGGLETEKDYPYTARRDHCSFNQTKVKAQIKGAVDLPKNETAIAQWLLQNGPVSIGINANAMQFYRGGVSHPWHVLCNKSDLDHGVLIVGFGVHEYPKFNKTLPYWIIKNSWGPRWGEQGYYRVYRGDNTCGVSEMVSSAVLE